MLNSFLNEDLLEKAISLNELGISNISWYSKEALEVINELSNNEIAILGGDVFLIESGNISSTGDSWYVDKKNITWKEYVLQSGGVATNYIQSYQYRNGDNFLYSLTVSNKPIISL